MFPSPVAGAACSQPPLPQILALQVQVPLFDPVGVEPESSLHRVPMPVAALALTWQLRVMAPNSW